MVRRGLILGGVLALFGCAAAYAEGAEISIDVSNASLQLTVQSSANIVLNPSTSNSFGDVVVPFSVATNNPTGYRVLMSVPQTEMLHNTITSANIPTLTEITTEANFPVNQWGYKTTGDYNPIKLTNEDPAWTYDGPTNSNNHSLTLAAKIDNATPAGTYTNTLTFQVVTNPNVPKDTIIFNGNGATSGTMGNQLVFQGEATKLNANTFIKTGYLFNGWNTKTDGKGVGYGDEDNYTSPVASTATSITLYAQWVEDTGQGSGSVGKTLQDAYEMAYITNPGQFPKDGGGYKHGLYVPHKTNGQYDGTYFEATQQSDYEGIPANDLRFAIQDIALEIDGVKVCDYPTVIGSEAYVLDLRDFKSYHILKAADGRCWMADNLALDPTNTTTKSRMSASNTNAPAEALQTLLYGTASGITGYARGAAVNTDSRWNGNNDNYYTPVLSTTKMNTVVDDTYNIQQQWKTGVFYNYCAASAGTYCYEYRAGPNLSNTGIDSPYDICPTGWRLPTGGTRPNEPELTPGYADGGEWKQAYFSYKNYYNSTLEDYISLRKAFRVALSGVADSNWANGKHLYAWSSTYPDNTNNPGSSMEYIHVEDSIRGSDGGYSGRVAGYSVRCIAK